MGFRFNRRITIIPGVHLNLGLRGASVSVGPRGASMNIGRKGTHATLSVPGTGLSYRTKLGVSSHIKRPDRYASRTEQDATLHELDQKIAAARCDLEMVYLDTPSPSRSRLFSLEKPSPRDVEALVSWRAAKANFENALPLGDEHTASVVEVALSQLAWPRPAEIDFRVDDQGKGLTIDVDLPELEDMPETELAVDRGNRCLVERPISNRKRADIYAVHIAGIVFRLLGALFAALPGVDRISISAYTTRKSGGMGERDDYVAAGTVRLIDWRQLDFSDLAAIDVEDAVRRVGVRMEKTEHGLLVTLQPCF